MVLEVLTTIIVGEIVVAGFGPNRVYDRVSPKVDHWEELARKFT